MTKTKPKPNADDAGFAIQPLIWWAVGLYACIELVLVAGDFGLLGGTRFRATAYEFLGFWPGILDDWEPNYAAQRWLMFLTYGFLHGGLIHLFVNMVTLVSLGPVVLDRVGTWKTLIIYGAAILGGGIGFALLSDSYRPMVGASGALFGLAGAILAWDYVDRVTFRARLWPVIRAVGLLILLNIVLYYAMDKLLAWEAHLGGFVAGWIMAILADPTSRRPGPDEL